MPNFALPFWTEGESVARLAHERRGIVVMPTGTGKTTQAPQLLHQEGFTRDGMIYVSVPRRVLAVELSRRVAEEIGVELGSLVGYQIRGEQAVSRETRILFMTEGVLRSKILQNPTLEGVSAILFDEFHMRTLMSDFNVALVERTQLEGSKVAFLCMSATIDPTHLAEHFQCGVVDGSGLSTLHPIEERYVGDVHVSNVPMEAARQVLQMPAKGNGLIFMPGKGEVYETIEELRRLGLPESITILSLHGELDGEERRLPFLERDGVTITVATDVVETGATLPNIGWVVDSGLAREVGYNPISDTSSLKVREVAQDRLWQRRGRCGRVMPGTYVGLFSEENVLNRPVHTLPEIHRRPLREVVLNIKALGLSREGKPLRLIDSPPKANWVEAKRQLQLLGLVVETPEAEITELGREAVLLGCDPREAAMLLRAAKLGCLREMAIAIAASQAPGRLLYTPKNQSEAYDAERAHAKFRVHRKADAWTAVQVVRLAEVRSEEQSLAAWCRENFVSYRTVREMFIGMRQLLDQMRSIGCPVNKEPGAEDQLVEAIKAGLPDRVFERSYGDRYVRVGEGDSAVLGRESVLSSPPSVVAWEIIEISTRRGGTLCIITNAVAVD